MQQDPGVPNNWYPFYKKGYTDYYMGCSDNPYDDSTEEYFSWWEGFNDAIADDVRSAASSAPH